MWHFTKIKRGNWSTRWKSSLELQSNNGGRKLRSSCNEKKDVTLAHLAHWRDSKILHDIENLKNKILEVNPN